jgi:hypothetical protein
VLLSACVLVVAVTRRGQAELGPGFEFLDAIDVVRIGVDATISFSLLALSMDIASLSRFPINFFLLVVCDSTTNAGDLEYPGGRYWSLYLFADTARSNVTLPRLELPM